MRESIISRFAVSGALQRSERFGSGLINDTYLCAFEEEGRVRKYILQHINKHVFRSPDLVMKNVEIVTEHIQQRLRDRGIVDPASITTALIRTRTGGSYHLDEAGEYWRMFHFIESGEVFDTVQGPAHAYEVGRGLGRFQALVSDLRPEMLADTLPGFHHTPRYLAELDAAVHAGTGNRPAVARLELAFVNSRRSLAKVLVDAMRSGAVPMRVVHNDPKVNNILVHRETGKSICMVDLDTVKPGIVLFDFGDCVRSAANPAGEDALDLDRVLFDRSLYQAITRGYLDEADGFLMDSERNLLPQSVQVITYELGIRFLADYLRGDRYFKTRDPEHNLRRARVQFRLLESIEQAGIL